MENMQAIASRNVVNQRIQKSRTQGDKNSHHRDSQYKEEEQDQANFDGSRFLLGKGDDKLIWIIAEQYEKFQGLELYLAKMLYLIGEMRNNELISDQHKFFLKCKTREIIVY